MTKLFILALNFLAINTMIFTQYAFADEILASDISNLVIKIEGLIPKIYEASDASELVSELKGLSESASSCKDRLEAGILSSYSSDLVKRLLQSINNITKTISNSSLENYTLNTLLNHATSLGMEVDYLHDISKATNPLDLLDLE